MILIVDNIVTPYCTHRYNEIAKVAKPPVEVWYLQKSESNRPWKKQPPANFRSYVFSVGSGWSPKVRTELNRRRSKIDRVVVCGWNSLTYLYLIWWSRRWGIRCTLWSGSTANEKGFPRSLVRPIVRLAISMASDYLVYGRKARQYLISLGAKADKIKIFSNNVDLEHFRGTRERIKQGRQLRERLSISPEATVFLFVGQLIERKGIDLLTESFRRFQLSSPNAHLIIVGVGPLRQEYESASDSSVHWLGHREYDELPGVYAAADLVILPSREEVWGLVVNEALAAGEPVIVSRLAGASEIVGARWQVAPDVASLTRKLRWFDGISNIERRKAVKAGQKWLQAHRHRKSAIKLFLN